MSSSYLQLVPDVESPYQYYTHHSNSSVGREDMHECTNMACIYNHMNALFIFVALATGAIKALVAKT